MLEEEREEGDMRESCDQLLYSCTSFPLITISLIYFPFPLFCFVSFHLTSFPFALSHLLTVYLFSLFALSSPLMSFPLSFSGTIFSHNPPLLPFSHFVLIDIMSRFLFYSSKFSFS